MEQQGLSHLASVQRDVTRVGGAALRLRRCSTRPSPQHFRSYRSYKLVFLRLQTGDIESHTPSTIALYPNGINQISARSRPKAAIFRRRMSHARITILLIFEENSVNGTTLGHRHYPSRT